RPHRRGRLPARPPGPAGGHRPGPAGRRRLGAGPGPGRHLHRHGHRPRLRPAPRPAGPVVLAPERPAPERPAPERPAPERPAPEPHMTHITHMGGPGWPPAAFAALILPVAAYGAGRLVPARLRRRPTELDTDAAHIVMGVAMAGMLASGLRTLPATLWA